MTRRMALRTVLAACLALGFARPAAALDARITEIRVAGGSLFAALELRDLFPETFRELLEGRAAIHLRLQIELW